RVGKGGARLLRQLAQRARALVLALVDLALRDAPGARVASGPERPAGMDEQHLQLPIARAPKHQDSRAALRHSSAPACHRTTVALQILWTNSRDSHCHRAVVREARRHEVS